MIERICYPSAENYRILYPFLSDIFEHKTFNQTSAELEGTKLKTRAVSSE